jgi:hypothetical protein
VRTGSGKWDVRPIWSVYAVKHLLRGPAETILVHDAELQVEEAFLEENRSAYVSKDWNLEVHVTVLNRGPAPLAVGDVWRAFRVLRRSGAIAPATVEADDESWPRDGQTHNLLDLPASGVGHIRVRAPLGYSYGKNRDDPAAVLAWETPVELH